MSISQIKLMNMKIKIKVLTEGCMPEIIEKGDWIDLKVAKNVKLEANTSKVNLLPLLVHLNHLFYTLFRRLLLEYYTLQNFQN